MRAVSLKIKASLPNELPSRRLWAFNAKGGAGALTRAPRPRRDADGFGEQSITFQQWDLGALLTSSGGGVGVLVLPPNGQHCSR